MATVLLYILLILLTVILLLNLLIAVMGTTYEERAKNAKLEWRWELARVELGGARAPRAR